MATSQEWLTSPPRWTDDQKSILLSGTNTKPIPDVTLLEIMKKSHDFPKKIPVGSICCSNLKRKKSLKILERNINSSYPVIHEHSLYLCSKFLAYQTKFGNTEFYKTMTLVGLIDRLLSKRAVTFIGPSDRYILLNGKEGSGNWENIGTPKETPPLILKDCLSYDEIKLSALLSVSSHTYFINDGNRTNCGFVEENLDKIEETGVIVGLIGTRLEKEKVMEYREIVKSKRQNTKENGYGSQTTLQATFLDFYGDTNATYSELLDQMKTSDRYVDLGDGKYFDKLMFERRITLSIDTLLIEANDRAKQEERKAYIYVVGIGLGVWKICSEQTALFMDTFAKRVEFLKNDLKNVSDVCFAYIRHNMVGPYKNGDQLEGIKIHIKNRNPHDKLKGADQGKLLVVSYAWDGNALPGNEFWFGSLAGSGDPAAASSTQVAELHNYHINGKVRGGNLRVATLHNGLVTFAEYQELHRND